MNTNQTKQPLLSLLNWTWRKGHHEWTLMNYSRFTIEDKDLRLTLDIVIGPGRRGL